MKTELYKIVKRQVTLIEMMIVMFLIAMIIGALAYNYQGTLEEGKAFKTKTAKEKLSTILTIVISNDPSAADDFDSNWKIYVKNSPLVQNPNDIIKDGWGNEFDVSYQEGKVIIKSSRYDEYIKKNPSSAFKEQPQEE